MVSPIRCCVTNLTRHQYGDVLNELQAGGVEIEIDRCQSQCVGCAKQAAFMTEGKWHGFASKEELKRAIAGTVNANIE
ncbi:hypothetical protein RB620_00030 [Paenibacillus sp. LHD-117]|uniref:hypothetical protein n=1 Tax=Paenibacillus sp. LHD-117 TaxID=3071412 RepID=UPI0027E17617|nr:hypothetical protein [Paenibacillus sp. LHD-117]MDQ6417811.1 hypothetical protein [Paenibacillus sp. LHD-117]